MMSGSLGRDEGTGALTSELLWGVVEVSCIRLDDAAVIHQAVGQKSQKLVAVRRRVCDLFRTQRTFCDVCTSERPRIRYVMRGVS